MRGALALLLMALVACGVSSGCAKSPIIPALTCAPNDATCQAQMGRMNDPACKSGTGSNGKCLDPRAPE